MEYKSYPTMDNAIALRLLLMLASPFKNWDLYKNGVMDDKGNIIMPKSQRTKPELRPTYLQLLVRNIKRLLNKVPGGENNLKNIIAAMILIKENMSKDNPSILAEELSLPDIDDTKYINDRNSFIKVWEQYTSLKEEGEGGAPAAGGNGGMPANNISSGKVALYDKPMKFKMFRRKKKVL